MKFKALILFVLCLCCSGNLAGAASFGPVNIEATLAKASQELKLPLKVIKAIAVVESGLSPWALNIAGKGFVFATKNEAVQKAREAEANGLSFDVGVMQINRWWLSRYQISLEAAFDPVVNVYFGGWILKQELRRHGSVRKAVGAYHSPNAKRAKQYANKVMTALDRGPDVMAVLSGSNKKTVTSIPKPKPKTNLEAKPVPMKVPSTAATFKSMKVQSGERK